MQEEKEKAWLQACQFLVEQKLQWGEVANWSQRDFESLSELILEKTGVLISVTTLKRALGRVAFKGMPLQTTLNALAQFLGYPDWAHFKAHPEVLALLNVRLANSPESKRVKAANTTFWYIGLFLLGVLLFSAAYWWYLAVSPYSKSGAYLHSTNNVADTVPHMVSFEYYIPPGFRKDVTLISFGTGNGLRYANYDATGHGRVSHLFESVGYFPIKIFANKTELARLPVVISSEKWITTAGRGGNPRAIQSTLKEGVLTIDENLAENYRKDTMERVSTNFKTFRDFNINADNFKFVARVRNPGSSYNAKLPKVQVKLGALGGSILFTFDKSPTVRDVYSQISDHIVPIEDQKHQFIQDLSDWSVITYEVKKRQFTILLNDKVVYNGNYEDSLDGLYGLGLSFRGIGEIDFVQLYDAAGNLKFKEEF